MLIFRIIKLWRTPKTNPVPVPDSNDSKSLNKDISNPKISRKNRYFMCPV